MKRNCSIDIARYVASLLVVAIHINLFGDFSTSLNYFVVHLLAPLAVPFFFMVAGYYCKFDRYSKVRDLLIYIIHQLVPYLIWSIIYLLLAIYQGNHIDVIYQILISGTYYHLWFIPSLIIGVIFIFILNKSKMIKFIVPIAIILYIFGCLASGYYELGLRLPVFSSYIINYKFIDFRRIFLMAIPFIILGNNVRTLINGNYFKCRWRYVLLIFSFCIYCIENLIISYFNLGIDNLITLTMIPFLIGLFIFLESNPLSKMRRSGIKFKNLSILTYYAHPFVIAAISSFLFRLGLDSIGSIYYFVVVNGSIWLLYNAILWGKSILWETK